MSAPSFSLRPAQVALERYRAWWAGLPPRQQWLVVGAVAVTGLGLVDAALIAPAEQRHKAQRQQIEAAEQQRTKAAHDAARVATEQARLHADEAALRARLTQADASIVQARAGLTSPEGLRQRVRDLTQDGSVRLVALTTLTPEPVNVDGAGSGPALYRFPLTVTVEGPYGALRDYLARLETSEQGLRWQSLSLDNRRWPDVRLEVRIALLSDRPDWRGP
jgi:type II secretory pathway component PulM